MKRLYVCMIVWFVFGLGVAEGVPSRPRYEPPDLPKPPDMIVLANTSWIGHLYTDGECITFHPDGTLTYSMGRPAGNPGNPFAGASPGSWKLTGNQLYFQVNQFSEFHTTIAGDVIQGPGTNKSGQKTQALMRRTAYAGKPGGKT